MSCVQDGPPWGPLHKLPALLHAPWLVVLQKLPVLHASWLLPALHGAQVLLEVLPSPSGELP